MQTRDPGEAAHRPGEAHEVERGGMNGQDATGASWRLPWGLRPRRAAAVAAAGYLLGSIPSAVLLGRRAGVDPRERGDRNPGFWNSRELLGTRRALPVFAVDMLKGTTAGVCGVAAGGGAYTHVGVGAAMVGHAAPAFGGLRGGRSVLTFVGGMAAISPATFALSWGVCLATTAATGSFAIGARAGVFSSPVLQALAERDLHRVAATGALMSFIGARFLMAGASDRSRDHASSALVAASPR